MAAMTTHPALQPVLNRSCYKIVTERIRTLSPAEAEVESYNSGYHDAKADALQLLEMMWAAIIIATDAVNRDIESDGPSNAL